MSTNRVRVAVSVTSKASPERAFEVLVNPSWQSKWMLGTTTYAVSGQTQAPEVGTKMVAFTGVLGVGFLDLMTVTELDPPRRWVVEHNGKIVRGDGIFTVDPHGSGSTITWIDDVDLPFGIIGRLGWIVVRPAIKWGFQLSMNRLAALLDAESTPAG
ncbi:SRPBCC family protein [Nakamurella antarctica]|uniref:SRPBCC family protein n=1 Tax=Nakamurella antarctica TaxID=1902245 RepID=A0A3G8ZLJ5_9ACTN|nr:SRPBCC family protein [Nakamurella antarctica]AZI58133.1 SRPBCC family protein [Nakamurella antarctica]